MLDSLSPPRIAPGNHPRPAAPPAMPQHGERERQTDRRTGTASGAAARMTDGERREERGERREAQTASAEQRQRPGAAAPTQPAQAITASRQQINQTRPASRRAVSRPAWTAGENRRGEGEREKERSSPDTLSRPPS